MGACVVVGSTTIIPMVFKIITPMNSKTIIPMVFKIIMPMIAETIIPMVFKIIIPMIVVFCAHKIRICDCDGFFIPDPYSFVFIAFVTY